MWLPLFLPVHVHINSLNHRSTKMQIPIMGAVRQPEFLEQPEYPGIKELCSAQATPLPPLTRSDPSTAPHGEVRGSPWLPCTSMHLSFKPHEGSGCDICDLWCLIRQLQKCCSRLVSLPGKEQPTTHPGLGKALPISCLLLPPNYTPCITLRGVGSWSRDIVRLGEHRRISCSLLSWQGLS